MKLVPNVGSDRSWVWNATADVSDGAPSADLLAIRFANPENANLFKKAFEDAQEANKAVDEKKDGAEASDDEEEEAKDEYVANVARESRLTDRKPAEEAKADAKADEPKEEEPKAAKAE